MEISKAKEDGSRVPYGTGRVFVQGPTREEWEVIADEYAEDREGKGKEQVLIERRMREEVVDKEETLVGFGEWAYYETAEEVSLLVLSLSSFPVSDDFDILNTSSNRCKLGSTRKVLENSLSRIPSLAGVVTS